MSDHKDKGGSKLTVVPIHNRRVDDPKPNTLVRAMGKSEALLRELLEEIESGARTDDGKMIIVSLDDGNEMAWVQTGFASTCEIIGLMEVTKQSIMRSGYDYEF